MVNGALQWVPNLLALAKQYPKLALSVSAPDISATYRISTQYLPGSTQLSTSTTSVSSLANTFNYQNSSKISSQNVPEFLQVSTRNVPEIFEDLSPITSEMSQGFTKMVQQAQVTTHHDTPVATLSSSEDISQNTSYFAARKLTKDRSAVFPVVSDINRWSRYKNTSSSKTATYAAINCCH